MPAPANTTPASALQLSVPATVTLDVSDAPEDLVHVPDGTGYGHAYNAVWFKFIPPDGMTFLYVNGDQGPTSPSNYYPCSALWFEGPEGFMVYYTNELGDINPFVLQLYGGYYFRTPVTPGTTYWLQVFHDASTPAPVGAQLTVNLVEPPTLPAAQYDVAIMDDQDYFPTGIFGISDGVFKQFRPFGVGEFADTLPTGEICAQSSEIALAIDFWDRNWNRVRTVPVNIGGIRAHRQQGTFYVKGAQADVPNFSRYSKDGIFERGWTLPPGVVGSQWTVSNDGARYYGAIGNGIGNQKIHVYNLNTETAEADLPSVDSPQYWWFTGASADGFMTPAGELVFVKQYFPIDFHLYQSWLFIIDAATGATLRSWPIPNHYQGNHMCWVDGESVLLWGLPFGNTRYQYFTRMRLSDGVVLSQLLIGISGQSNFTANANDMNEVSNSCPVFVLPLPLSPPGCITSPPSVPCWGEQTLGVYPARAH